MEEIDWVREASIGKSPLNKPALFRQGAQSISNSLVDRHVIILAKAPFPCQGVAIDFIHYQFIKMTFQCLK
jgi:hypothetical protein